MLTSTGLRGLPSDWKSGVPCFSLSAMTQMQMSAATKRMAKTAITAMAHSGTALPVERSDAVSPLMLGRATPEYLMLVMSSGQCIFAVRLISKPVVRRQMGCE